MHQVSHHCSRMSFILPPTLMIVQAEMPAVVGSIAPRLSGPVCPTRASVIKNRCLCVHVGPFLCICVLVLLALSRCSSGFRLGIMELLISFHLSQ